MKFDTIIVVRVYITEQSKLLKPILEYLKKETKIRGCSVFRAISGYGESGTHFSSLLDLSLDLPLVVEFFDHPEKIEQALEHLNTLVKPEHIVFWEAKANENGVKP